MDELCTICFSLLTSGNNVMRDYYWIAAVTFSPSIRLPLNPILASQESHCYQPACAWYSVLCAVLLAAKIPANAVYQILGLHANDMCSFCRMDGTLKHGICMLPSVFRRRHVFCLHRQVLRLSNTSSSVSGQLGVLKRAGAGNQVS